MTTATSQGATLEQVASLNSQTPDEEVKYRAATKKNGQPVYKDGQPLMLAYVTARYVQDTLDTAVGPHNWQTVFTVLPGGAVNCALSVNITDRGWITKSDVGVASNIEPEKGAYSDALKRAAVNWGIARDLYDERDADPAEAQPEQQQEARPPMRSRMGAQAPAAPVRSSGRSGGRQKPVIDIDNYNLDDAPWDCPIHGEVKIVPGGVSKRTQKEYGPFFACPIPGCDERGGFLDA